MKTRTLLAVMLLLFTVAGSRLSGFAAAPPRQTHAESSAPLLLTERPLEGVETSSSYPLPGVVGPDAAPSIIGTYVVMELYISGTPCFDCVNGNTKGTFGSGYPLGYVNTNTSSLGVLLEWFDVSYKGSCTVKVTLALGGKVLKSASGTANPSPGGVQNALMKVTRSSGWHGSASMSGKVVCGGTTIEKTNSVYFQ